MTLFFCSSFSFSQTQVIKVHGMVKASGKPVVGATIKVVAQPTTVVTDSNGLFELQLKAGIYNLSISAVEHNKKLMRLEVKEGNITSAISFGVAPQNTQILS